MVQLPSVFTNRMKHILGGEYEAFIESYSKDRSFGLRLNTLHEDSGNQAGEDFEKLPFSITPVPWSKNSFFYSAKDRPGHHILHEAGAYYIQEPSAMIVAELAKVQPGEIVCDLCASPGGKSTQVLGHLNGTGFLVSNEISSQRAHILSQNIERFGSANSCILNEDTDTLAMQFASFFDVCIVDAPCSGEGMFRKDEGAIWQWSPENVLKCASRQLEILENADRMLKPGGRMIYSTCTFAPEEDECVIASFLLSHPDYELKDVPIPRKGTCYLPDESDPVSYEICEGRADLACEYGAFSEAEKEMIGQLHLERCVRMWPHHVPGEGHFAAILVRKSADTSDGSERLSGKRYKSGNPKSKKEFLLFEEFAHQLLKDAQSFSGKGFYYQFGEHLYLLSNELKGAAGSGFSGYRFERAGLELGEIHNGRFLPAHALSHAFGIDAFLNTLEVDDELAGRFLSGEVVPCEDKKGWLVVCYHGHALGFGKAGGNMVKNHYPKGLRIHGYKTVGADQ